MILAVISLAMGCGQPVGPDAGVDAGPPNYEQVQLIFSRSCAVGGTSCHAASGRPPNLTAGASYAAIVNVDSIFVLTTPPMKIIAPSDPENSFLLRKVDGTFGQIPYCAADASTHECGVRMPMVGGQPLAANEIALIRAWIMSGAPEH
jgi:hypothetical protein